MNRLAFAATLLFATTSFIGCATLEVPYVPPGHAGGWDPVFGNCDTCGTCGGHCEGHTPASYIGHQLRCAGGCGEIYWGPWLSNPPDQCDPCNDCGEFVGDRCCEPKLRQKVWWKLTGQSGVLAHGKGCSDCGGKGCSSCGGAACTSCGGKTDDLPYYDGQIIEGPIHEAPIPEEIPSTPPAPAEVETPAAIRPLQGVSLKLPFSLRSTRFEEQQ